MQNTLNIFEERSQEIEFYFSVMIEIDNGSSNIRTIDNIRFYKIMKSNFLLMLYNLVEASIVSGIMEIYEELKNDNCSYSQVVSEIKKIWSKFKISEIYGPATERVTYEKRVQDIIKIITTDMPITLSKEALEMSGNLNAKKIKEICDRHGIRYRIETQGESLERVKRERNSLAHGDVSFSDCARDLTISDLEDIKNEVVLFLKGILEGMRNYYDNKLYRI